eukprot:2211745-Prymnesium_polylepis.2
MPTSSGLERAGCGVLWCSAPQPASSSRRCAGSMSDASACEMRNKALSKRVTLCMRPASCADA